eukprot:TRINITY_DN9587_c0_g3_i1.p1 TRINITY_DN9587_c0_g3~~TRINITY_DN9587_c0_g3_i1.p1  ORF type:complete len:195 (+),score=41.25 TRINITY_DN9587_c0_g3_i1:78-662(+)
MQNIQNSINEENYLRVIEICEEFEMTNTDDEVSVENHPYYGLQLLSHLILQDTVNARFTWKRTPESVKQNKVIQYIWAIGRFMWERNYEEVFNTIKNTNWPETYVQLLQKLEENFRENTINLISRSYNSITLKSFCEKTGYSPQDAINEIQAKEWEFDEDKSIIRPVIQNEENFSTDQLNQLKKLTDYVAYLAQ